ncbi:MAG: hypothetical protein H6733_09765 [Alphaproteobacteria bacterium]|nr:hypothetical protein [Alphaproteobacteria bacterium]
MPALVVLVTAGACGTPDGVTDRRPPPPGDPLVLVADALVRGETTTLTISGATPGDTVVLAWSPGALGPGPCLSQLGGLCLDIPSPRVLAARTAAADGTATLTATVPPTLPLGPIGLQAAVAGTLARTSNPVAAAVTDPEPSRVPCTTLTAPHSVPGARLTMVYDDTDATVRPSVARLGMRPIVLGGTGMATLDVDGPLEVWTAAGQALSLPWHAGDSDLPADLLVYAKAPGHGALHVTPDDPTCAPVDVEVAVLPMQGITGHTLPDHPWFETAHLFFQDEAVEVALDPTVFPDRVGQTFDVWIVPHLDRLSWARTPRLRSGSGATGMTLQPGTVADNTVVAWTGLPTPERFTSAYDVVVDFDKDGRVTPGDLLFNEGDGSVFVSRDLTVVGPYGTRQEDFDGGTWRKQRVYAPTLTASLGTLSTVVISHGNGQDYTWYDYLGQHLASYGFVAMSHSSNTNPGPVTASGSLADNLGVFYGRTDTLFGGALAGRIGPRQAWIGHSRGGEAVAILYNDLEAGARPSLAIDPLDVAGVASIAPTDFNGDRANPQGVPYHLMAGSSDGDVTGGPDCDICQYWRVAAYASGPVTTSYVYGAAHNDFHDEPSAWRDGVGPDRIGQARTNVFAKAYLVALAAWWLDGETAYEELFTRGYRSVHPAGIDPIVQVVTTSLPDEVGDIGVIDDFQANGGTALSSSGGTVTGTVTGLTEGLLDDPDSGLGPGTAMNGFTEVSTGGTERGAVFTWAGRSWLEWQVVPALADATRFSHLQLRLAQRTRTPQTVAWGGDLSVTVQLRDAAGHVAALDMAQAVAAPEPYQRAGLGSGAGWIQAFQTVRVRLTDFLGVDPDLDLTSIVAVRLQVGTGFGADTGSVGIDDLAFVHELPPSPR